MRKVALLAALLVVGLNSTAAEAQAPPSLPVATAEPCPPPFQCNSWTVVAAEESGWTPSVQVTSAASGHPPLVIPLLGAAVGIGAAFGLIWLHCMNKDCVFDPSFPLFVGGGAGLLVGWLVDLSLHSGGSGAASSP